MADYTTVAAVAAALDIDQTDYQSVQTAVSAASRLVDSFCGQNFDQTTATRVFEPSDWYYCPVDQVATITSLKTDAAYDGTYGITWSASDYVTDPVNGIGPNGNDGWPITGIRSVTQKLFPMWGLYRKRTVQITGTFGWSAVPDDVTQACLLLAEELFKTTRDAPLGTSGFGDFGPVTVRGNKRVADLLASYRTVTAAGSSFLVA